MRAQRNGTVINGISSKQERLLRNAVQRVANKIVDKFPGILDWKPSLRLIDVIAGLKPNFPYISFASPKKTSNMKPDGGFLYIISKDGARYPILITEKKNQGTNDLRAKEGKKKQAKGMSLNALERM